MPTDASIVYLSAAGRLQRKAWRPLGMCNFVKNAEPYIVMAKVGSQNKHIAAASYRDLVARGYKMSIKSSPARREQEGLNLTHNVDCSRLALWNRKRLWVYAPSRVDKGPCLKFDLNTALAFPEEEILLGTDCVPASIRKAFH